MYEDNEYDETDLDVSELVERIERILDGESDEATYDEYEPLDFNED